MNQSMFTTLTFTVILAAAWVNRSHASFSNSFSFDMTTTSGNIGVIPSQNCQIKFGPNGSISDSKSNHNRGSGSSCWNIYVPPNSFIRLEVNKLTINVRDCNRAHLKISVVGSSDEYKYCDSAIARNPVTALNNVTVTHFNAIYNIVSDFEVQYEIQDIECTREGSFRCSRYSCIPKSQVCDGVKHCENGQDEVGCKRGILGIEGVEESLHHGVSWLKQQRSSLWGWHDNSPRAVIALFLASAVNFNGKNVEEELMVKQAELRIAVALLRPLLTNNELSMFVNALLVTCHNPRHFYGKNLVKRLKTQVEVSRNFTHPAAYLALCNANETWPAKATDDLNSVLSSDSNYPFVRDIQAMAVLAISCVFNRSTNLSSTLSLYTDTIQRFKTLQLQDGSFGNVHTTSLITQALVASGQEDNKDWKLSAAIEYLMNTLNSTSVDFLFTYLTIPILNGKSLADISKIDCSSNPRKHGEDVSEIQDYLGPKMQVKYSLYIGDEKNVIHTISLRVPVNFTVYEVMQMAQVEDPKYKFEEKQISGKIYVYKIANVINDPEVGNFWLQYISSANSSGQLEHSTDSPDDFTMKDGDHLVMWYKAAHI